jgi:dolichol-phosphate mannosyltransferase
MTAEKIDYSIILPVYFNEGCLEATFRSLRHEVVEQNPGYRCEIIFIDDGSEDGSLLELMRIRQDNPELVKVIKLTRNFGQVNALLAGFSHARGRCVVAMSADGQDPANLINDMLKAHFQEEYEVVICTRYGRDESYYRIITSKLFYALMRKLTFPAMPKGGFDFILMGERSLKVFMRNIDVSPFLQGQILWMGFRTKFIEYRRRERVAGVSRWTFGKKLTYLIDGVLAYSFTPIRVSSIMGGILAFLGFIYALIVLISKLIFGNPVKGWAPIMITVLIIGGFQLIMQGIIGEYTWRTLAQARQRDMYVIDEIYE